MSHGYTIPKPYSTMSADDGGVFVVGRRGYADGNLTAEVRQQRGRKQAEARKTALVERVANRRIEVPAFAPDELARLAVEHRNIVQAGRAERRQEWDDYLPLVPGTVPLPMLKRLAVNFLRHECTSYDEDLDALYGRVGRQEAAAMVRRTVLDAIAEAYPQLADECERQR